MGRVRVGGIGDERDVGVLERRLAGRDPSDRDPVQPGEDLLRRLAALARLLTFWLKYFDRLLLRSPAGVEGASGTYFLGRRSEETVSDRALVREAGGSEGGYLLWRG